MDNEFSYDGLCISSGGYKGIAILGALTVLEMNGHLRNVNIYSGCSVGGIITFLLACGWKPIELYTNVVNITLFHGVSSMDIKNLNTNHGFINNDALRVELEALVLKKKPVLPTMLDLYNDGIYVSFSVCDRRTKKGYKLDYTTNPNLLASEAALMSANIPFMFTPIEFNGMQIIDGALTNPFPLDYIDNEKRSILGIVVYGNSSKDENIMDYILGTIMIQIEELQRHKTRLASKKVDVLEMSVQDMDLMSSSHGFKVKNAMFFAGVEDGKLLSRAIHRKHRRSKKNSKPSNVDSKPSTTTRVNITHIPDDVLLKCFMSQPVDILSQAANVSKVVLQRCIQKLAPHKLDRLKILARELLVGDISYGSNTRSEYKTDEPVEIKENYSQKLFDNLPPGIQTVASDAMKSMSPEQSSATIHGLNFIFEGLTRLGINIFDGLMLSDGRENQSNVDSHFTRSQKSTSSNSDRVQVMEDDEYPPGKNAMDDVD